MEEEQERMEEEQQMEEEQDVSERVLEKCMPEKIDTEAKIKRMLEF